MLTPINSVISLKKTLLIALCLIVTLSLITWINYALFTTLGLTGVTMLYLLLVVTTAYYGNLYFSFGAAVVAFLLINYFFVVPRYTFQIQSIESWASLISFLVVSLVVSSLVKRLKLQTAYSVAAYKKADFLRALAEQLALAENLDDLLSQSCALLQKPLNKPCLIAAPANLNLAHIPQHKTNEDLVTDLHRLNQDGLDPRELNPLELDQGALEWAASNGKPIGPHTSNWPESTTWYIPFNRLPSKDPVLVIGEIEPNIGVETYQLIVTSVSQISSAYQRLVNLERAKHAEREAHEEAIQSTILASIAHDMRTPLTSILGAATTLQQNNNQPDVTQTQHLVSIITAQSQYLANTTENILSLMRLESSGTEAIPMELESPEEMIGAVIALYQNRNESIDFKVTIKDAELFIKANVYLLMQAMTNLIENAKRANALTANAKQTVEIEIYKQFNKVNISISDNGPGFKSDFKISDIKKFTSNRAKGIGLGLSIVHAIVKKHAASLDISNRPLGGACVTLSFDIAEFDTRDV